MHEPGLVRRVCSTCGHTSPELLNGVASSLVFECTACNTNLPATGPGCSTNLKILSPNLDSERPNLEESAWLDVRVTGGTVRVPVALHIPLFDSNAAVTTSTNSLSTSLRAGSSSSESTGSPPTSRFLQLAHSDSEGQDSASDYQ